MNILTDISSVVKDLQEFGYSTVSLPSNLVGEALDLARQFFAFDEETQMSALASASSGVLGFYPSEDTIANLGGNVAAATLESARARGYSSFDFIDEAIAGTSSVLRKNVWPSRPFGSNALCVYRALAAESRKLSLALLDQFEQLGWVTGPSSSILTGPSCSLMRLLSYDCLRPSAVSKAHTDYEFLSLILTTEPGLQVKTKDGDWVDLFTDAPFVVVLAGDMTEALTSGRVQSRLHRVQLDNGKRTSVIFFQGLPLDTRLAYRRMGVDCPATFEAHLLPLLARGAAHLRESLDEIEKELGCAIPDSNLFKVGK